MKMCKQKQLDKIEATAKRKSKGEKLDKIVAKLNSKREECDCEGQDTVTDDTSDQSNGRVSTSRELQRVNGNAVCERLEKYADHLEEWDRLRD